jgi:hypothetical protein
MNATSYSVLMKSGRRFLVEELASNTPQWNATYSGMEHSKKALVKEVVNASGTNLPATNTDAFKNTCVVAFANRAIEYINTLDALGLERLNSEAVTYLDC